MFESKWNPWVGKHNNREKAFSKNTDDYNIFLTDSDEFVLVSTAFQTGLKKKGGHNCKFDNNQKPTLVEYAPERKP